MEADRKEVEELVASLVSVPLNMFVGLASLLTAKGVISREDIASLLQRVADRAPAHGENEATVRMLIGPILAQFEQPLPGCKC
jgi:hypothetical protein